MKIKILSGLAVILLIVMINSCENKLVPLPASSTPKGCDTLNLTYSSGPNKMKPIIDAQCGTANTQCHSPGSISTYDFSTYAAGGFTTANNRHYIYSSLFNGTPTHMPKINQPGWTDSSTCMLAKFKAWINAGIPQ